MEISVLSNIWEKALHSIREQVTAENYSTYFRPLQFKGFENGQCHLEVTDSFFGDWVRSHYTDLLVSALSSVVEEDVTISIQTVKPRLPIEDKRGKSTGARPSVTATPETLKRVLPTNADYRFDKFVVGPSNELANAAFQAASRRPACLYNPLFLYGPTGLGKTHLLCALGQAIREENPDARIIYVSAEEFTNQVVKHIRTRTMDEFRDRYRNQCDVLLIDDIHVLEGKERTQEEFFHTFNALHQLQRQIVLTSDRNPEEMGGLEARLRSRFQWGLICDIQPPELETRVAILQSKAERDGVRLPLDVAFFVAERVSQNIRQLEGALLKLCAYAQLRKQTLTPQFAAKVLDVAPRANDGHLSIEKIIEMVAAQYGIDASEITGKRRLRKFAHPRSLAMYLCRKYTQASFPLIGKSFGGKDHSTVVAACKKIEQANGRNATITHELTLLEQKLPTQKLR